MEEEMSQLLAWMARMEAEASQLLAGMAQMEAHPMRRPWRC